MGQPIEIESARTVDDSVIFTMDRSLTSQNGEGYESADDAAAAGTFGGDLAKSMLESDDTIARIYVASNIVVAKRTGGWTDESRSSAEGVVEAFFLFYPAA